MTQPALFRPSAYSILESGLKGMTLTCETQAARIADLQLRCDELIARNAQLEERDYLNKGEVE